MAYSEVRVPVEYHEHLYDAAIQARLADDLWYHF